VIHSLNTLQIIGHEREMLEPLFAAFIAMYPAVRHLKLSGASSFSQICADYLTSLAYIETLVFDYDAQIGRPEPIMHLPSLLSLSAVGECSLQHFELPNLLGLTLVITEHPGLFGKVAFLCLRQLTLLSQGLVLDLCLEPSKFPELRNLTIDASGFRWHLLSLPKLVSITLSSSWWDRRCSTLLCVELLYHPEYCPALRQIWFGTPVEWDILFLMLERRNHETGYVSMIDIVSLPYIPFILRKPLGLLLEGRRAERPSNLELSFAGVLELVCDSTM
jgi:hypothetical protein